MSQGGEGFRLRVEGSGEGLVVQAQDFLRLRISFGSWFSMWISVFLSTSQAEVHRSAPDSHASTYAGGRRALFC